MVQSASLVSRGGCLYKSRFWCTYIPTVTLDTAGTLVKTNIIYATVFYQHICHRPCYRHIYIYIHVDRQITATAQRFCCRHGVCGNTGFPRSGRRIGLLERLRQRIPLLPRIVDRQRGQQRFQEHGKNWPSRQRSRRKTIVTTAAPITSKNQRRKRGRKRASCTKRQPWRLQRRRPLATAAAAARGA